MITEYPNDFYGDEENNQAHSNFSIRHGVIEYPAFCEATRKIEQIHRRWRNTQIPTGILLTGQSGSGKTTVLEQYKSRYPKREETERTVEPILSVSTPAKPSVKNLAEAMLEAFGGPALHRGSAEEKTRRIYKYMRECRVEMLFLDEFHHFLDARRFSDASYVTDWLKNLINYLQIPVVIAGLPRAAAVIRMNEQLARRFSSAFYLRPFSFDSHEGRQEFRAVLKLMHSRLPVKCVELHEANLARRFYVASNGLIDYVAKIIDEALMLAAEQDVLELDEHLFSIAFEDAVWRDVPAELNPFNDGSVLRQLDQIGEPFERWDDPKKWMGSNDIAKIKKRLFK